MISYIIIKSQVYKAVSYTHQNAKIELSSKLETDINLPFITVVDGQPVHLEKKLTRAKFEELIRDLVESTRTPIENAMKDAKLTPQDIDAVLLVGGSTSCLLYTSMLKEQSDQLKDIWAVIIPLKLMIKFILHNK